MDKNKKKKYRKPDIKKIKLDAKTAVLGFCKTGANLGPNSNPGTGCEIPYSCSAPGS
jgi:hypothetical protein